eukprot:CAMPEP_0119017620 /NCGR_PEP_ID=MMETSP1176-20130426/17130_1 /TAXON_ID=265551 /ORGANISM="Synedropsis recta cf, Strain CCMP1620" /LENGTH=260 /DNA_ID=CAMNT_0006971391 /DNA_START=259 /DNA_END=1041 /DNA_ORIENTATION=-
MQSSLIDDCYSGCSTSTDTAGDGGFLLDASFDSENRDALSLLEIEAGIPQSTPQSTPCRRSARSRNTSYDTTSIHVGTCTTGSIETSSSYDYDNEGVAYAGLLHGCGHSFDDSSTPASSSMQLQQPILLAPQRKRKRCNLSLWIFRSLILLADVVLFLVLDDSASNTLSQAANPPPGVLMKAIPHAASANSNQLSHARAFEAPEFRLIERLEPLERYVMEISPNQHSTGWIVSAVLIGGVCLEVLFKEVYLKRRERQRDL